MIPHKYCNIIVPIMYYMYCITVAADHESHHEAERVGGHRTSRNLAIILGVLLPLVIVIYISLVGAFLAHRELQMAKHKKSSRR